jgi:hypothetical protein
MGEPLTWPSDPARAKIVEAVAATTLTGTPSLLEWDRGESLGRQAWRRFSVLATGGDLTSLTKAPAIGAGGIVYVDRTYACSVYYERGKHRQSIGKDSDAMTDDAERIVGALCRMDYDTPNTGLELLHPRTWRVVDLPNGALSIEIDLFARVRREL